LYDAKFPANSAGAFFIEINASAGARGTVVLNGGLTLDVRPGRDRRATSLRAKNRLAVRLTGEPGSFVEVMVLQEVHAVTVTPGSASGLIPTTAQFTAVATDVNGVVIPGQTFVWSSSNTSIATIDASSGLARTTGPVYDRQAFNYQPISTGEGIVQVNAAVVGVATVAGYGTWSVKQGGFVYATSRAPLPLYAQDRYTRPLPQEIRYDSNRLSAMRQRCITESTDSLWVAYGLSERRFYKCYPALEGTNLFRQWYPIYGYHYWYDGNVAGLYGHYCGHGFPDGAYWEIANNPNYDPLDPIDAMCMDHDKSGDTHRIPAHEPNVALCVVRYGIENETLYEDGVSIPSGSPRFLAFLKASPSLAIARDHFYKGAVGNALVGCNGFAWTQFKHHRGL